MNVRNVKDGASKLAGNCHNLGAGGVTAKGRAMYQPYGFKWLNPRTYQRRDRLREIIEGNPHAYEGD